MPVTTVALALMAPQTAGAATTIGAPTLAATPAAAPACPRAASSCAVVFEAARADAAGVVVRWRIHAAAGEKRVTLRAARRSGTAWHAVAGDTVARTITGGTVESFPARMPLAAGDALALEAPALPAAFDALAVGSLALYTEALPALPREPDATADGGLLVQADVEPDTDGDGYGDESQDECPGDADRREQPCPVALSAATLSAPQWAVVGEHVEHRFRVANAAANPARDVRVAVSATPGTRVLALASSRGACADGTCAIDRLPAGEAADVVVAISGDAPGEIATSVAVTSASSDGASTDDAAAATTTLTPPSVAPPPTVFPAPACANVRLGTNDDELLEGSAFGDRLVGRGGRDLIRGHGGDDCLEGGRGGDVLGGGAGRDRLSGGYSPDRLYGDFGDDKLEAGNGDDTLSGGTGNDQLFPGRGADRVSAGPGNDTVSARDRTRDHIDCGPGPRDSARVDHRDRVRGCERVSRG